MNTKFVDIYLDFIQFHNKNIMVLHKDPLTILLNLYLNISFLLLLKVFFFLISNFNFTDN